MDGQNNGSSPTWVKIGSSVALVSGTTVGAGILALASVSQKPGFFPSAIGLIFSWVLMATTGLLFAEVSCNVAKKTTGKKETFGILAMSRQLLGRYGAIGAGLVYLFIHYALLIAYIAEAGRGIGETAHLASAIGPVLFATVIGGVTAFGSTAVVETMNNTFFAIVVLAFFGLAALGIGLIQFKSLEHFDLNALGPIIPIELVALVYHNVVPNVCVQLNYHKSSIRTAVALGSLIPMSMFIVWNFVILGQIRDYSAALQLGAALDPIDLLESNQPAGNKTFVYTLTTIFSQAAIVTSFIGFYIGLMDFFIDIFPHRSRKDPVLVALVLVPPTLIAIADPNIFVNALDFAGTYGITVLFGIVPAILAWKLRATWNEFSYSTMRHTALVAFASDVEEPSSSIGGGGGGSTTDTVSTTPTPPKAGCRRGNAEQTEEQSQQGRENINAHQSSYCYPDIENPIHATGISGGDNQSHRMDSTCLENDEETSADLKDDASLLRKEAAVSVLRKAFENGIFHRFMPSNNRVKYRSASKGPARRESGTDVGERTTTIELAARDIERARAHTQMGQNSVMNKDKVEPSEATRGSDGDSGNACAALDKTAGTSMEQIATNILNSSFGTHNRHISVTSTASSGSSGVDKSDGGSYSVRCSSRNYSLEEEDHTNAIATPLHSPGTRNVGGVRAMTVDGTAVGTEQAGAIGGETTVGAEDALYDPFVPGGNSMLYCIGALIFAIIVEKSIYSSNL